MIGILRRLAAAGQDAQDQCHQDQHRCRAIEDDGQIIQPHVLLSAAAAAAVPDEADGPQHRQSQGQQAQHHQ